MILHCIIKLASSSTFKGIGLRGDHKTGAAVRCTDWQVEKARVQRQAEGKAQNAQTGRQKRQECTDRQKEKEDLRRSALTGGKEWQECEHLPVNVALLIPE